MNAPETYNRGRSARAQEVSSLDARAKAIASARLVLAAAGLVLLGVIVWGTRGNPWVWALLGGAIVTFGVLVVVHARVHEAADRAGAALRFYERGLARLRHDWDKLPLTSSRFRTADHPFCADLDIFGRASLMQLVDVTETSFGEERLARCLALEDAGAWPDAVAARQDAVRDLSSRLAFREALSTAGGVLTNEKPDPTPLLHWAESSEPLSRALVGVAWVVPCLGLGLLAIASMMHASPQEVTALVLVQLVAGLAASVRVSPMLAKVSARQSSVTRWRAMISLIEGEGFDAPLLERLRRQLASSGGSPRERKEETASQSLGRLERVVGFADARQSEVFRLLIGPLLMWDVHCAAALTRWRTRDGGSVRRWLGTLGEIEALAGLAAFAFEHPEFAWPSLAPQPTFEAQELAHPLIDAKARVANDVRIPAAGRALVVTGSNMSGKSTLLRAIGVNAVLAFAGAPVCARALSIGAVRVATSMRVEDSLERGVSHFYAELQRLKRVLDLARGSPSPPVLFLMDEILHGTNSRERVIGACVLVRELLALGTLGAISTHDLGITALERDLGGKVENVHFEEQVVGDKMTFDYVLRPGVVQSSNALRLMRAIGILPSDSPEALSSPQ